MASEANEVLLKDAADQLAKLHLNHYMGRTPSRRLMETVTMRMSHPGLVYLLVAGFCTWIGAHVYEILVPNSRLNADPNWLAVLLAYGALLMTALILAGQRREEDLSDEREELTLHLLAAVDRKISQAFSREAIDLERAKKVLDEAHEEQFKNR